MKVKKGFFAFIKFETWFREKGRFNSPFSRPFWLPPKKAQVAELTVPKRLAFPAMSFEHLC